MIRIAILILVLVPQFACAEREHLLLPGKYLLVGKAVDSNETYTGTVEISEDDQTLNVRREIDGTITVGTATVESALQSEAKVLRIRFTQDSTEYEKTCLWHSDLDNYARISCYLYRPGEKTSEPGLEVMFHDHKAH